jgi:hypothetical protein
MAQLLLEDPAVQNYYWMFHNSAAGSHPYPQGIDMAQLLLEDPAVQNYYWIFHNSAAGSHPYPQPHSDLTSDDLAVRSYSHMAPNSNNTPIG